jgi:hypothetical protein
MDQGVDIDLTCRLITILGSFTRRIFLELFYSLSIGARIYFFAENEQDTCLAHT